MAEASKEAFAARLKSLRMSYGAEIKQPTLSMNDFAKLLGLEAERYRRYERAEAEPPLWVLGAIRKLTGVSLNSLVAGEIDRAA